MKEGPLISTVATLIGERARADMLAALMDGRALAAGELANEAGITPQTASQHLAMLVAGKLLLVEQQGRHRYYRLSGSDVAELIESLSSVAQRTGAVRTRSGPKDPQLRHARLCYDHLAGEAAVRMMMSLQHSGFIRSDVPALTDGGRAFFLQLGISLPALETGRRPLCRFCLDWSERRHHLGGALGAELFRHLEQLRWIVRGEGRAVRFTAKGTKLFADAFGAASPPH